MTKQELRLSVTWILKYIVPVTMVVSGVGYGYLKLMVDPAIECRVKPIKEIVVENNYMLKEVIPQDAKIRALDRAKTYKRLED